MFGKKPTQKEMVAQNKRNVRRSQRDLDRELLALDREEQKATQEVKRLAKAGQNGAAKVMAKEIVRIRKQREKLINMKAQLGATSTRVTTMQASQTVAKSMVGATKAMGAVNQAMPAQQMQRTAMAFDKQNEMAQMKQEMMDDAFDDMDAEEEEEVDEAIDQVLDSIGLDYSSQMAATPGSKVPTATKEKGMSDKEVEQLLAQMP